MFCTSTMNYHFRFGYDVPVTRFALVGNTIIVDVRRSISYCDEFKTWATTEIVIDYIQSDIECAKSIAGALGDFTEVETSTIADVLCNHSDPAVRMALAASYSVPKKILKQLLTDPEHSVRCAARESLD